MDLPSLDRKIGSIEALFKNTRLLVSIIIGLSGFAFPIYAYLTSNSLIIPSIFCGIMFVISVILSLISYYEAKLLEIKNAPEQKLTDMFINGNCSPVEYNEKYAILVEKGLIEPKKSKNKKKTE